MSEVTMTNKLLRLSMRDSVLRYIVFFFQRSLTECVCVCVCVSLSVVSCFTNPPHLQRVGGKRPALEINKELYTTLCMKICLKVGS
jgi:hypothetical protein